MTPDSDTTTNGTDPWEGTMAKQAVDVAIESTSDLSRGHYTESQLGAFFRIALFMGRLKKPGVFVGSAAALKGRLPRDYARHVGFLIEEGDLIEDDGTVRISDDVRYRSREARKQAAYRDRKRNDRGDGPGNASRDDSGDATVTAKATTMVTGETPSRANLARGTGTPSSLSSLRGTVQDISGDVRVRAEGKTPEKAPETTPDPIANLLLERGLFDLHPRPRIACEIAARKASAWGLGFEEVGALVEHAWRSSPTPRRLLGWAFKDAGKMKVARSKMPPPRAPDDRVAALLGGLGGALRSPVAGRLES